MPIVIIIIAVGFGLVFLFRDAHQLSSIIVLVLLFFAASAHLIRQRVSPKPPDPNPSLREVIGDIRRNVTRYETWGPLFLLVVEWLCIAIAAHFVVNDIDLPFQRLRILLSFGFACYKQLYFAPSASNVCLYTE